ncbi:MAG: HDIG domain-containing protein [Actinomycetota bacterium]|nr:HDIG domain-containing protein [Actinomycetota bacterium]
MPGSPSHLTRRFFDVLRARPLLETEQAEVRNWLGEAERSIFFAQPDADQRHGLTAALTVMASGTDDRAAIRAALLHDVGKRYSRLGLFGRVLASVLILLRLPLRGRLLAYRDHGEIAALELEALGAEPLVVEFARHHHRRRPPTIEPGTWDLLRRADQPPKTWPKNHP